MKKLIKITGILLGVVILIVGGYVAYLSIQYYRIDDLESMTINNKNDNMVLINQEYTISSFNIGFGAYTHEFSFFMDSGTMLDGRKVNGSDSTAKDKQTVLDNTNGAINSLAPLDIDFKIFQEVDIDSTRSFGVNQFEMLSDEDSAYSTSFASNFHTGFLMYPLTSPHGKVNSGIATLSKFKIDSAIRHKLPIDESFPNKFFDLDRCFLVTRFKINETQDLVIANVHFSAYDEGGLVRAQQLDVLNEFLTTEYNAGNYVIAGGDFNHDIANTINSFPTTQEVPNWVYQLTDDDLATHFTFKADGNVPTCRSTDMPYIRDENYTVVIDGYIVSDNIDVLKNENLDLDFVNSDHNPTIMTFKLS